MKSFPDTKSRKGRKMTFGRCHFNFLGVRSPELIKNINSIYLGNELFSGESLVILERYNSEKVVYKIGQI